MTNITLWNTKNLRIPEITSNALRISKTVAPMKMPWGVLRAAPMVGPVDQSKRNPAEVKNAAKPTVTTRTQDSAE
jgi:hypothetical protein